MHWFNKRKCLRTDQTILDQVMLCQCSDLKILDYWKVALCCCSEAEGYKWQNILLTQLFIFSRWCPHSDVTSPLWTLSIETSKCETPQESVVTIPKCHKNIEMLSTNTGKLCPRIDSKINFSFCRSIHHFNLDQIWHLNSISKGEIHH